MDKNVCISILGVCVAFIVFIGAATFTCADDRRQVVKAIEAGAEPMAARCALKGTSGRTILCYETLKKGR